MSDIDSIGTTDVTRTMHFGTPSEREKMCYTLVLKVVVIQMINLYVFRSACNCICTRTFVLKFDKHFLYFA